MSKLTDRDLDNIQNAAEGNNMGPEGKPFTHHYDTLLLVAELRELRKENARLKSGNLTPEEYQNLCHNLDITKPGCTREDFVKGCEEYQKKIFGEDQC